MHLRIFIFFSVEKLREISLELEAALTLCGKIIVPIKNFLLSHAWTEADHIFAFPHPAPVDLYSRALQNKNKIYELHYFIL